MAELLKHIQELIAKVKSLSPETEKELVKELTDKVNEITFAYLGDVPWN